MRQREALAEFASYKQHSTLDTRLRKDAIDRILSEPVLREIVK